MVDTEMTATPTQQPDALRLADALKRRTPFLDGSSTIDHAEKELRRQNAEISSLMDELEKERTARQEAQAMAECLDMLRTDLIAAGVVGPEVAPMFLTEAVLSEVSLERTARIEAQMRLHIASLSDAVTAEREACAELMEQQHTWITNVAASALIRARGTP